MYANTNNHFAKNGGVAELADAYVVHLRVMGSNQSKNRKCFHVLFVLHLNSNL
jgi:hypothetical protein